jgi:hypothetical protein
VTSGCSIRAKHFDAEQELSIPLMDSVDSAKKELRQHFRHALWSDYKGDDKLVNTYLPGAEVKLPKSEHLIS